MKVEDRRFITFTRKELEAALIAAAGLPADTTINSFTVESACLAPPQPVVSMSVTIGQSEAEITAGPTLPTGPVNCTHVLRREGKSYPRTCARCGLGPCPFYDKDGNPK